MIISFPKMRQMARRHPRMMARILNRMKRKSIRHWQAELEKNETKTLGLLIKYLTKQKKQRNIV